MNSELTEKTDIKEWQLPNCADGLSAPAPRGDSFHGWILYDGNCQCCAASAKHFDRIFRRRGFLFLPLQTNWVMKRLNLEPGAPLEEMRVLTADGGDIAGADAVILLAHQIWWAWPFVALARLPGPHQFLDRGYRWIAAHRGCDHIRCNPPPRRRWPGWIALMGLPLLALPARNHVAPWQFMWVMTGAIFLGCKWLTFSHARRQIVHFPLSRALAYFFVWPGMDAERFVGPTDRKNLTALNRQVLRKPGCEVRVGREWRWVSSAAEQLSGKGGNIFVATAKIVLGVVLLFGLVRFAPHPLVTGWIGMIGIILILHFGLFHLLAIAWRAAGVDAEPIMDAPLHSKSLSEFWSRRWNAAFNRLALDFVFRPLTRRIGGRSSCDAGKRFRRSSTLQRRTEIAMLATFLVSGLIHELVISLPARAGYGLPTAYFLLQGIGILTERALPQIRGQIFTIVITAVPVFWLFHPPFVRNVILPFMKAIGAV